MIKRKKYQRGVVVKNKIFGDEFGSSNGSIKAQFGIKQLRNDNSNNDVGFNVDNNKLHPNEVKDKNIYGASKKFGTYLTYPEKVNRVRNINKISGNPYVLNEPIDDRDIDTSGYFRAHATNDLNSIHIPKNNPEQIISEYPHTYQFKNVPKEQYDKKFNYDIELNDKDHEKTYIDKNSAEYEAHHIIEPVFEGYIRGNLKDTNDVKRFIDYRNQLNNKPYKEIPYQGGNPVDDVVSNPNGIFGWARNVFLEEQGYPKDTVSKYPKNIVENYIEDKLGGEPYSLNRNLNPKYKSLEIKKHGGTINKHKRLKLFNMINRYEYGGRIGDESFIGRTSNVGLFKGIDNGVKKKKKLAVSTLQPKWALNNGAIPSYHNLGLRVKAKMGGKVNNKKYYKSGGLILGTGSSNIASMLKEQQSRLGYNPGGYTVQNIFNKNVNNNIANGETPWVFGTNIDKEDGFKIQRKPAQLITDLPNLKSLNNTVKDYNNNMNSFKEQIASNESKGMGGYNAINQNSGAAGKYQFLPSYHKKDIERLFGVNWNTFVKTPELQERYMDYWTNKTLRPTAQELLKKYPNAGFNENQLMAMVHFQGAAGAEQQLRTGTLDKTVGYNKMTTREYVSKIK